MTASARRGPAYSRPSTDAPFVDTRFVHVPTPAIVPPLDFTRLNDVGTSQHLQALPPPQMTAATTGGGTPHARNPILRDAQPEETNPMQTYRHQPRQNPDRSIALATKNIVSDGITYDGQELPNHRSPASKILFQEPGLSHPKPPDIPAPREKREMQGVGLRRESLSARLARLSAGGSSGMGRVVPMELV